MIQQWLIASYPWGAPSSLLTGLLSYWKVDGNSTDSTWTNSGTDTNVTYTSGGNNGKINQGANFVGTGGINLSTTSSLTNQLTFSFWVNCTSVTSYQWIFVKSDGVWPTTSSWAVMFSPSASSWKLAFSTWNGSSERRLETTALSNNTWYHVVCTYDGATMKIYINNWTPVTLSASWNINNITKATAWGRYGSYAGLYLTWAIDEMGVWSRAITAAEVTTLYNGWTGLQYPF